MTDLASSGIDPLYAPCEEPNKHRIKASVEGAPAEIINGRRPSPIAVVQNLRAEVSQWRANGYPGTSATTRDLFAHWFDREHRMPSGAIFRYHFCQREAIETFVYLREVQLVTNLSAIIDRYAAGTAEERFNTALGISPEEDLWPRYAFKVATGAGKTKIMSMAVVWSYFHAQYESDSPMCKNFLVVAPNLIVFERLKEDFQSGHIFENDPLIPEPWKSDFNLSVVLQDEAIGTSTGGVLYLTNIHRLYDNKKRKPNTKDDSYEWMGPTVSRAKALELSKALRDKITSHDKLLVLNDEAHHVWDVDSTWNECISYLHATIKNKFDNDLVAQLDFSATPKDNRGQLFRHIVTDTPLGEAVDAGIVKTPIIGSAKITEQTSDNAAVQYQHHLLLGYKRWNESFQEWQKSNKKTVMFVMTENAESANEIATELNTNPLFKELNGKTLNLHTRLKGKLKKKGKGPNAQMIFEETEKDISLEDLKFLRELARDLDNDSSPYQCIVSVLMLREGWDVNNVTTIVPLRAYTSKANILAEQTLGRGLRRMTPPGQANELITVVEHPAFANLYTQELAQQGVIIDVIDVEKVPRTTVSIYPDQSKNLEKLAITIPILTHGFSRTPSLEDLTIDDIKKAFAKYKPLKIGEPSDTTLDYVGKHLITQEIIEQSKIQLPLLDVPGGAISYFRAELERQTKYTGLSHTLQPLLETFFQEVLFEKPVSVYDNSIRQRLADADVREHVRATFLPLILARTTVKQDRIKTDLTHNVTEWKPFQATYSQTRPVLQANNSPFNLVPCVNHFESAFARFLSRAEKTDVLTFCKNAGPQALRIDYINSSGQLALYTPDFIVKTSDKCYLVECKGRSDHDVPLKAKATLEWCKSASKKGPTWEYVYVTESVFQAFTKDSFDAIISIAAPALSELISEISEKQLKLPLAEVTAQAEKADAFKAFVETEILTQMPSSYRNAIEQAIGLFLICEKQKDYSFAPVFQPLLGRLDNAAQTFLINQLAKYVPVNQYDQREFFDGGAPGNLTKLGQNLRKTLVYKTGQSVIGLLKFCLDFENRENLHGVWKVIEEQLKSYRGSDLSDKVETINDFRNTYVAHEEQVLTDVKQARVNLKYWIEVLVELYALNHPATFKVPTTSTSP